MNLLNKLLFTFVLVVGFTSHTYAMSWEEEFGKFQKTHTVPLQNAIKSITEFKDSYFTPEMKTATPKEQDQAIKLLAVWQIFSDETDLKAGGIDKWIMSSGYKNFPDPKADLVEVRAFSNYHKKIVDELRILTRETRAFSSVGDELIKKNEITPLTFLQRVQKSLNILDKAKSIVDKLPTSIKVWDPKILKDQIEKLQIENKKADSLKVFLEKDSFILNVLNKARDLFYKENKDFKNYADEILKSISLEDEEWRKEASVKKKIQEILDENFGN